MTYLEQLPRCTDCDRILRTKDGRPWCIDCRTFSDDQPTIVTICDHCGWMTPQPDGRTAIETAHAYGPGTIKRGCPECPRCAPGRPV